MLSFSVNPNPKTNQSVSVLAVSAHLATTFLDCAFQDMNGHTL